MISCIREVPLMTTKIQAVDATITTLENPNILAAQQAVSAAQTHATTAAARPAMLDLTKPVSFLLDEDMRLACEDQAQVMGVPFETWLQGAANDALRSMLGL